MHVAFIGFGLIGGSIARAVRTGEAGRGWTMSAWSPSGRGPGAALADGTIDHAATTPERALVDADLIVLAGPPTACLSALGDLAGRWSSSLRSGSVVTDVASTKAALVARADAAGLRFVGGHPMAGLDASGYEAGRADLFVDRPWVIVPGQVANRSDVERVTALVGACRARAVLMDGPTHDEAVAGISHLPLILATALAEAVVGSPGALRDDWPTASGLAASGWRDMTRLARGDPAMGAGIVVTNAAVLADRLRDLQARLDAWRIELERPGGPDEAAILERMRSARESLGNPS